MQPMVVSPAYSALAASTMSTPQAPAPATEGFDWKKYLVIGGAIAGVAALAYYLLSDTQGEKRAQLQQAVNKFDEGVRLKEAMELEEAESLFAEALTTFRKYLTPNDDALAQCHLELSHVNLAMARTDKALHFANEALRIKESEGSTPAICPALLQVARCHMLVKEWAEAANYIDRAQEIYESESGIARDLHGLATAIRSKAMIFFKQGQYRKAEETARQALEQFKLASEREVPLPAEVPGARFKDVWECQNLVGRILQKAGKYDDAEAAYKELVESISVALGTEDANYAYGLRMLADFYRKRGNLDLAENYLKQAVETVKNKHGENQTVTFSFMCHLAHFYWEIVDQPEKAQEIFAKLKSWTCLPTPTASVYLQTRMFAFTFTRSVRNPMFIEPLYVGELMPTKRLRPEHFLEISYENPADPDQPIVEERELKEEDQEMVVLMSPTVTGVKPRMYEIVVTVWDSKDKTKKIGEHHQLCQSAFDTDKIHTEEDLMKQLPQDRL